MSKPPEKDSLQEAIESALRFWGRAKRVPQAEVDEMIEQSRKIRDYYDYQQKLVHETPSYKAFMETLDKY